MTITLKLLQHEELLLKLPKECPPIRRESWDALQTSIRAAVNRALGAPPESFKVKKSSPDSFSALVFQSEDTDKIRKIVVVLLLNHIIGQGAYSTVKLGINAESGEPCAIAKQRICPKLTPQQLQKLQVPTSLNILDKWKESWEKRRGSWISHIALVEKLYPITPEFIGALEHAPGHARLSDTIKHRRILVTNYCSKGDLFDAISRKQLNPEQKAKIAQDLLNAVGKMHSKGVAHLDIKPENIVLKDDLTIALIDFDFSQKTTEPVTTPRGSTHYMAPEIAVHLSHCNAIQADLWSLGATLYSLFEEKSLISPLIGAIPDQRAFTELKKFGAADKWEESGRWIQTRITEGKEIPEEWQPVLTELLQLDPTKRNLIFPASLILPQ